MIQFDDRDAEILAERLAKRIEFYTPLVGDFVEMPDGTLHRFTHDWGDGLQTAPEGHGSYYLERSGRGSYSGALEPIVPNEQIELTKQRIDGAFWFFHHDSSGAHRGVHCKLPCRVWRVMPPREKESGS